MLQWYIHLVRVDVDITSPWSHQLYATSAEVVGNAFTAKPSVCFISLEPLHCLLVIDKVSQHLIIVYLVKQRSLAYMSVSNVV